MPHFFNDAGRDIESHSNEHPNLEIRGYSHEGIVSISEDYPSLDYHVPMEISGLDQLNVVNYRFLLSIEMPFGDHLIRGFGLILGKSRENVTFHNVLNLEMQYMQGKPYIYADILHQ